MIFFILPFHILVYAQSLPPKISYMAHKFEIKIIDTNLNISIVLVNRYYDAFSFINLTFFNPTNPVKQLKQQR